MKTYKVEEVTFGDKTKGDRILFQTITEMNEAYKDIDNGLDVYVEDKNGIVTKLLNRMINAKIADGRIQMCAKKGGKDE